MRRRRVRQRVSRPGELSQTALGLGLITTALVALSCGGPAASTRDSGGPATGAASSCKDHALAQPPTFQPPPAVEIPESQVTVEAGITLKRLERELSQRVPTTLDKGSRGIGSAGRLGYVVKRGPLAVALEGERLVVTTPVTVNAQVCKPIGPFCPTYGSCSPKLGTQVSVPLVVGRDYRLGESEVQIQIERSCSIAGFDATPQIRRATGRQATKLKRQIDAIVNQPPPESEALWRALHSPMPLPGGACLRAEPSTVSQSRPRLDAGVLSTRIAIAGTLTYEHPCETAPGPPATAQPLPEPQVVDELPDGIELHIPIRSSWVDVSAELTGSLNDGAASTSGAPAGGLTITGASAQGALSGQQPVVALTLQIDRCGERWLIGEPWVEPASKRIRLRHLRSPAQDVPLDESMQALASHIERHGAITIPMDLTATTETLSKMLAKHGATLPPDVELEVALEPAALDHVLLDRAGLVAIAKLRGHLRARLR
ncbi:MAG: hypothetical protein DRI90_28195 [Deltaproteobacteria bacterium]|nr:MAG: hypothetical protein DRI90_28195 [Deltaproteobacteria bacterium]